MCMEELKNLNVDFSVDEEKIFENLFEERKQSIKELTQVVKRINKPFTITLTSEWGTGKTYFLKAWEQRLKEEKIPVVYYNAWKFEQDFDPLMALIGNIVKTLKAELDENFLKNLFNSLKRKVNKNTMLDFFGAAGDIAVGLCSAGSVNDAGTKITTPLKNETTQTENDNSLFELLGELKDKIHQKDSYKDSKYPIVVMIDELDRCKPDYVISLLERIKHIFTMNGYVFVLSMDQEQLYATIEHVFGFKQNEITNKDFRTIYLQKFVDFNYRLVKPNLENYIEQIIRSNIHDIPLNWEITHSILATCPEKLQYAQQYFSLLKIINEKLSSFPNNDKEKKLYTFQNEVIKCVQRLGAKNLRDFEKKIEKFLILYKVYSPDSLLSFILLEYIFNDEPSLSEIYNKKTLITDNSEIMPLLQNNSINSFELLINYINLDFENYPFNPLKINYEELSEKQFDLLIYSFYFITLARNLCYNDNKIYSLKEILCELEQMLSFSKHIELFS